MFESKANEVVAIYKSITDATSMDKNAKVKFVNEAYNCMNMMNKLIAIAINDIKVEQKKDDNPTEYEQIDPPMVKDIRKRVDTKEEKKDDTDNSEDMGNNTVSDADIHVDDPVPDSDDINVPGKDDQPNNEVPEVATPKNGIKKEEAEAMSKKLDALANATRALGEAAKVADLANVLGDEDTRTEEQKEEDYQKFMDFVAEWEDKEVIELLEHEVSCWGDGVRTKKGNYIAGIKDLLAIDKMIDEYEVDIDDEDLYKKTLTRLGCIQNKKPEQIEKNIQTVINKADFTKSAFLGLIQAAALDGKKPDVELLIREFIDFYADDEDFEADEM